MDVEMGEVITFYGVTDGVSVGGTLSLDSDVLYAPVSYIRPDKGMETKIWVSKIMGKPATVFLEHTEDVTVTVPTWRRLSALHLETAGSIHEDQRRPIKLMSRDGKQAWRLIWEQVTAGVTYFLVKVQFTYKESN